MTIKELIRLKAITEAAKAGYLKTGSNGHTDIMRFIRFWDAVEKYFGRGIEIKEICRNVETIAAGQDYVNKTEDGQFDTEQIYRFCSEMEKATYSLEELLRCTES